jgi:protocatechuate 3,4-dioxygenase, beta subunit
MNKTPPGDAVLAAFARYDDASQPSRVVAGYPNTRTRTPAAAPVVYAPGLSEITGPTFDPAALRPGEDNLAVAPDTGRRAIGQIIALAGRVSDEDGRPVRHSLIELWQANGAGRYIHGHDDNDAPLDPDFIGVGRAVTDGEGVYRFITIKPGAYPVPNSGNWWRPPHIHFSLFGSSAMSRLVTQMYFPGEPLNAHDRLINSVPDAAARERLVCRVVDNPLAPTPALGFAFDIVLRGRAGTPWIDA